ncbi:Putative protein kinase-like domain superfamily [Colletotrichum destructivum]|uniref:Protein kinase domain-containing protein n=1 Tax=Colletotrichum destructivum TaxID=34406 RepID=A0AAX4J506_9PEZI|nr:Putative protein kinase-like domain superfamily [Colletotrichum destructivum]
MMTGGTTWYVPPDLIVEQLRGAPGDVWRLGVTTLCLLEKIRILEKTTKSWLICEVKQGGDGKGQMIKWLKIVTQNRNMLNCNDFMEVLVS